ncbi:proton-conducting transporter membrane subunit [Pantoea ananatis]
MAVILRTALLPVHGWLIQVMEAPTPVSAPCMQASLILAALS